MLKKKLGYLLDAFDRLSVSRKKPKIKIDAGKLLTIKHLEEFGS
jgi:hypothetical protein